MTDIRGSCLREAGADRRIVGENRGSDAWGQTEGGMAVRARGRRQWPTAPSLLGVRPSGGRAGGVVVNGDSEKQLGFLQTWLREHGWSEHELITTALDVRVAERLAKLRRRVSEPAPGTADLDRQIAKAKDRIVNEDDPEEQILTLRQISTLERRRAALLDQWQQIQELAHRQLQALVKRMPMTNSGSLDDLAREEISDIFAFLKNDHDCESCTVARQVWRMDERDRQKMPSVADKSYHSASGSVYHGSPECEFGRRIRSSNYCDGDNEYCVWCNSELEEIRHRLYAELQLRPCKGVACMSAQRAMVREVSNRLISEAGL